jgi:hypothetical protein
MAKKKGKKKAASRGKALNFLKSRGFIFTAATMLGLAVIIGMFSMAGGSKTRGRLFSAATGTTLNSYAIQAQNPDPDKYQFVTYTEPKWGGQYLGVYTEITEPALGREIAIGTAGNDVLAVKAAIKAIGGFTVTNGATGKATALRDAFAPNFAAVEWTSNVYDANLNNLLATALSKDGLDSSYGKYAEDSKLDSYEIARIFTLATDPGFLANGTGIVFDYNTQQVLYEGAIKGPGDPAVANYEYKVLDYKGGKDYLTGKNEKQAQYYYQAGIWVNKTKPSYYSRTLREGQSGGDVKVLQAMLNYVKGKHGGDLTYAKLKITGKYDANTQKAVKGYVNYYGAPQGFANKRVLAMLARELNWGLY